MDQSLKFKASQHTMKEFPQPVFVKRKQEMGLLKDYLRKTFSCQGNFILINGEAGCGKTALVNEFEKETLAEKANFMSMCFSSDSLYDPYAPFTKLIEDLEKNRKSHPILISETALKEFPEPDSIKDSIINFEMLHNIQSNQGLVQQKILSTIFEYAQETSLVIEIKDIHFASQSAWQFFHYLADKCRETRILFIATLRQDGMQPVLDNQPVYTDVLARMNRDGFIQKITLDRFSVDDIRCLLIGLFQKSDFSGNFISLIYEISGGLPDKLMKYLKLLYSTGDLFNKNGIWFHNEFLNKEELIQKALLDFDTKYIRKEFQNLNPEQKQVLKYASLIELQFDYQLLALLTAIKKIILLKILQKLKEKKFIVDHGEKTFKFKQPEIRNVIKHDIQDDIQNQMHLNIALKIEESNYYSDEKKSHMLAYHYYRSSERSKAFPYFVKAGDYAIRKIAFIEANEFYKKAIDLLGVFHCEIDKNELIHLYIQSAWLNRVLGNYNLSIENCKSAYDILGKDDMSRVGILIRIQESFTYFRLNNWAKAQENLEQSLQHIDQLKPFEISLTNYGVGNIKFELGEYQQARDYYLIAQEEAKKIDAKSIIALLLNNLGVVENVSGNTMKAIALYSQAIPIYQELNDNSGLAKVYNNIGLTYADMLDWEQANKFYGKSLSVTGTMGLTPLKSITFLNRAMSLVQLNKIAESQEYSFKAFRLLELLNDELGLAEYHKIMGIVEAKESNWESSANHFKKALDKFNQFKNNLGYAETLLEYGIVESQRENKASARAYFVEAKELFSSLDARIKEKYTQSKIDELQQAELMV